MTVSYDAAAVTAAPSPDLNDLPATTADLTSTGRPADFTRFSLPTSIVQRLLQRGITAPTDVQIEAIPLVSRRQNLIVQAKTGTGKTFAFGLPLLNLLQTPSGDNPRALVITPTRELALQVHRDLEEFGALLGLRTVAAYGGTDAAAQIAALRKGVDVVVGTPGRLLDLSNQKALVLRDVAHVVLDEADEMLDMGFLPDITKILTLAANRSQTLLFSATMPTEIRQLARRFAPNPYFVQVSDPDSDSASVANVTQRVYKTHPLDKPEMLARILQAEGRGPSIVFCRTKRWAQRLSEEMNERGFNSVPLHGDLSQSAREKALESFRAGRSDVLIATDVAARGIDIDGITHVVNYDAPEDAATYLHRIGRTARAGRSGTAVTFVDLELLGRWVFIARELGLDIDPTETFSTSPHLYSDLSIPEWTRGRLKGTAATTTSSRSGTRTRDRQREDRTRGAGTDRVNGRRRARSGGTDRRGQRPESVSGTSTTNAGSRSAGDSSAGGRTTGDRTTGRRRRVRRRREGGGNA